MTTPQDEHAKATPHKPEREPLTPIQPIPVRDVLFVTSIILSIAFSVISVIVQLINILK